jgi:hypothetical protein
MNAVHQQGEEVMGQAVVGRGVRVDARPRIRLLLGCGVIAGFMFIGVSFVHAIARPGYRFSDHPLSLLSHGSTGLPSASVALLR